MLVICLLITVKDCDSRFSAPALTALSFCLFLCTLPSINVFQNENEFCGIRCMSVTNSL